MSPRPTAEQWQLAVEALTGLVREEYGDAALADLAFTYCGTMVSERASEAQLDALRVVEVFMATGGVSV